MAPITQKSLTTLKSEPLPLEIGLGINASFSRHKKKKKKQTTILFPVLFLINPMFQMISHVSFSSHTTRQEPLNEVRYNTLASPQQSGCCGIYTVGFLVVHCGAQTPGREHHRRYLTGERGRRPGNLSRGHGGGKHHACAGQCFFSFFLF